MIYARIKPDGGLETSFIHENEELSDFTKGMKPLNQSAEVPAVTGLQSIEACYEETDTEIVASYHVVENHPKKVAAQIKLLKQQLTDSDYKIIKSYEATLLERPLPYDIAAVHQQRQQIRGSINQLEQF